MFSFTNAQVLLNQKYNIMVVTFQSYWCVSYGSLMGRGHLPYVLMTYSNTIMRKPPGSSTTIQSRKHVLASSKNTDILTLGRPKV